ncbi:MAG: DsbA family oxidoreductase [Actinomycetota bacterium]
MKVEVWSDVVCPWCYIGKRRFEAALAQYREQAGDDAEEVEIIFRPFMLDPSAPPDGRPVQEVYEKKFGGPEAAKQILDRVTSEAAGEGLTFRMDIALRANTLDAHRLLVLSEGTGHQAVLKERLMQAYFTEGTDIGDRDTLVALGVEVGMDEEMARAWLAGDGGRVEVAESLTFAADNGLTGVPTYVFDRRIALPGAQPAETFVRVLERVAATDGPVQLD